MMARCRGRGRSASSSSSRLRASQTSLLAASVLVVAMTQAVASTARTATDGADMPDLTAATQAVASSYSFPAPVLRPLPAHRIPDGGAVTNLTSTNSTLTSSLDVVRADEGSRHSVEQNVRHLLPANVLVPAWMIPREKGLGVKDDAAQTKLEDEDVERRKAGNPEAGGFSEYIEDKRKWRASREPAEERSAGSASPSKVEGWGLEDAVTDREAELLPARRSPRGQRHEESRLRLQYRPTAGKRVTQEETQVTGGGAKASRTSGKEGRAVGNPPDNVLEEFHAVEGVFIALTSIEERTRTGGMVDHARRRLSDTDGTDGTEAQAQGDSDDDTVVGEFGSAGLLAFLVCFGLMFCVFEVVKCYCCIECRRRQRIRRRREDCEVVSPGFRIPVAISRPLPSSLPKPQEKDGLVEIVLDGLPLITQLDHDDAQGNIPSARGYAVADASRTMQQAMEQARRVLPRGSSLRLINRVPPEPSQPPQPSQPPELESSPSDSATASNESSLPVSTAAA